MSQISRDTPPLPPPPPPAPPVPTPWPLWKAVLLSPFRPVGLLTRSDDLTIKGTLLIHVIGLLVGAVVFIELSLWAVSPVSGRNFHPIWDVWNALRFDWRITVGGQGIIAFIDAALLLIGVVLSAWGARDETVRQSSKRSIKRAMLLLPHVILLVLLIAAPTIGMSRASQLYDRLYPGGEYFVFPPYPSNALPGSPEMLAHQEAVDAAFSEYQNKLKNRLKNRPWYQRYRHFLDGSLWFAGCTWALWVLIVGFSYRPAVYRCRWPACCEQCGYSLMGLRDEQTCPECGHSVALSRSWDARPGTAWDRRHQTGTLKAWAGSLLAFLRPSTVGGQTRLLSADGSHHRLLLFAWLLLPVIHLAFMFAWVLMHLKQSAFTRPIPWDEAVRVWMWSSLVSACALTAAVIGSAMLVGRMASWYAGRNLLCIAAQGASHLVGVALVWWTLAWGVVAAFWLGRAMIASLCLALGFSPRFPPEIILVMLLGACAVFGVLHFWIALWRYTMAARHANW